MHNLGGCYIDYCFGLVMKKATLLRGDVAVDRKYRLRCSCTVLKWNWKWSCIATNWQNKLLFWLIVFYNSVNLRRSWLLLCTYTPETESVWILCHLQVRSFKWKKIKTGMKRQNRAFVSLWQTRIPRHIFFEFNFDQRMSLYLTTSSQWVLMSKMDQAGIRIMSQCTVRKLWCSSLKSFT